MNTSDRRDPGVRSADGVEVMVELLDELEQRNAALEQANSDLRHFAEVAAHDLRSPLTLVRGYIEQVLRVDANLPEHTVAWLNEAAAATHQMTRLVDALLSHTVSTGTELTVADVSLNDVFDEACTRLAPLIERREATLRIPRLPTVRGDRDLLVLVAQNVIDNAVKYVPEGRTPVVDVTTRTAPSSGLSRSTCVVRVRDNGVGIALADRERVFALFGRGETAQPSGHGIGLATCARIVARHGGRIRVGRHEGPGTIIEIELPLAAGADR